MFSKEEIERRNRLFDEGYLICGHCKQTLPIENFYRDKGRRYGRSSVCKECSKIIGKKYSQNNKKSIQESQHRYREKNKELLKMKKKERDHRLKTRFSKYQLGAKSRNIQFELTLNEFDNITSKPCFYCGDLPTDEFGYKFVGVDRIDSAKGYFVGNVIPCCADCNRMKSKFYITDWITQISKIMNHLKEIGHEKQKGAF